MRIIYPGHTCDLDNLKANTTTRFSFHKDARIHGVGADGPSCQEVLRMLIDRVKHLDSEKPWEGNREIVKKLREAIALFEHRALMRKIEKEDFPIEYMLIGRDGHLALQL